MTFKIILKSINVTTKYDAFSFLRVNLKKTTEYYQFSSFEVRIGRMLCGRRKVVAYIFNGNGTNTKTHLQYLLKMTDRQKMIHNGIFCYILLKG